ncbi:MAG: hypothetical protein Q9Q13_05265 [Acidobacteriota bacterium]|nr:hypothetical protein [Acidobacteriota bacterium]
MTSLAREWGGMLAMVGVLIATMAGVRAAEYQLDFDYPNQGDDWYGRVQGADFSRDYLGTEATVDTFSDGDDYGRGYDPAFASMAQNVELLRMQRQQFGYRFYFEPTAECLAAADCDDGLPCNGTESCGDFQCAAGAPPSCDDGDVCTDDSCIDPTGCSNTLVPPPRWKSLNST